MRWAEYNNLSASEDKYQIISKPCLLTFQQSMMDFMFFMKTTMRNLIQCQNILRKVIASQQRESHAVGLTTCDPQKNATI